MLKYIESGWQDDLQSFPGNERFYIDFRLIEYPNLSGTPIYGLVTGGAGGNQPGTYNMTDGYSTHLISLADEMTFDFLCYADFDYDVAADQPLLSWYRSATQYLKIYYDATSDKITVAWKDGTNERTMTSEAYADGLNDWLRITVVFDLTSPYLYIDGVEVDDAWSDAPDAITSNFDTMQIRAYNSGEGLWYVNYLRMFTYSALAADVSDNFKGYKGEEIFFDLDGNQVGKTRCNVTRFVRSWNYSGAAENDAGNQVANRAGLTLLSLHGEFADDQYSAFDPENAVYNGLITQKYLQQRCRVEIESWYSGDFEPLIRGHVDSGHFSRVTQGDGWSEVSIGVEDYVAIIANTYKDKAYGFRDYTLSSTTDPSLFHEIASLATNRTVVNYLCDSGFEAAPELIENGNVEQSLWMTPWGLSLALVRVRGCGYGQWEWQVPAGWVSSEGFTSRARTGNYSIAPSKNKGFTGKAIYLFHDRGLNKRGLKIGVTYTLSIWIYNPTTYGCASVGIILGSSPAAQSSTATKDAWVNLTADYTVPDNRSPIYVGYTMVFTTGALSRGSFINVDDISLTADTDASWTEAGSITVTRSTDYAHTGSRSGKLVFAAAGSLSQTLMLEEPLFANVDDNYTATIYALSEAAFEGTLRLAEHDSDGSNDDSTIAISLAGGEGWTRFDVTHTISDEDSDRLVYSIEGDADTVYVDTGMLVYGDGNSQIYFANPTEGDAGVSYPSYGASLTYNACGVNADSIAVRNPYSIVPKNSNVWDHVKQIADACGARYMGMDKAGVLTMKTHLVDDDPTPVDTVDVPSSVATQLEDAAANKIVVQGDSVRISGTADLYWLATQCAELKTPDYTDRDGKFLYPMPSNGDTFPKGGGYLVAKYGE
jgi:hypothetical protein